MNIFRVRTGLIQLHNFRALDAPTSGDQRNAWSGSAQSFLLGGGLGLRLRLQRSEFFALWSWDWRYFPSIEWKGTTIQTIPSALPPDADFSGWSTSLGMRYQIS